MLARRLALAIALIAGLIGSQGPEFARQGRARLGGLGLGGDAPMRLAVSTLIEAAHAERARRLRLVTHADTVLPVP
jgi:hypothetical protein